MAGFIAVGIGLGAEKLGRIISEKRLERKENKRLAEREAIYGTGDASSSSAAAVKRHETRTERKQRKKEEAMQAQDYSNRRISLSEERISEDDPPPRYEDVVREGRRRA